MPGGNPRGPPDRGECPACTSTPGRPVGALERLARSPRGDRVGGYRWRLPIPALVVTCYFSRKKRAGFARVGVPGLHHS